MTTIPRDDEFITRVKSLLDADSLDKVGDWLNAQYPANRILRNEYLGWEAGTLRAMCRTLLERLEDAEAELSALESVTNWRANA